MTTHDRPPTTARRGALGKGISSLLGDAAAADRRPAELATEGKAPVVYGGQILSLELSQIEPNPAQPRKVFNDSALQELAASLKADGVLQPVIVTTGPHPGRYRLIAGERRWRASKLAGLSTIPALVKDGSPDDLLRLALIENIQRADLNILEEAEAYQALIKDLGLTQEQCADRVGKERSTVANTLRLLQLPREVQDDIVQTRLSMGHGRAMLSLEDKRLILRCRDIVLQKGLNVRQTEQLCKTFKVDGKAAQGEPLVKDEADLQYITDSLRTYLHTKVRLAGSTSRGKIEISYFSGAELERILTMMGHRF